MFREQVWKKKRYLVGQEMGILHEKKGKVKKLRYKTDLK